MRKFKRSILFTSLVLLMMGSASIMLNAQEEKTEEIIVTDLNYIEGSDWTSSGDGKIHQNKNIEEKQISLFVNDEQTYFDKGVGVHAPGKITYDIRNYTQDYSYFTAKLGVDASKKNQGGEVKFIISISKDNGNSWIELDKTKAVKSSENAISIYVPVLNADYIRISFDPNGATSYDHSVMVDAKLVDSNYVPDVTIAYPNIEHPYILSETINSRSIEENIANHKSDIFKYTFLQRIGYSTLQDFVAKNPSSKEKIDWLVQDEENLKLLIDTGEISYPNAFLSAFCNLYEAYQKLPINDNNIIYKKMMIAAAVAYSSDVLASPFTYSTSQRPTYDIVKRYQIMVQLFDENKFYNTNDFNYYHMEHYRMIMADSLANDELIWLNEYARSKNPNNYRKMLDPYTYMRYTFNRNYGLDKYYSKENKTTFDQKYSLSSFGVPYGYDANGNKITRTWIGFEEGGICWNISRLGQNLHKTFGIPVVGVFQPAHEAYISLSYDANGIGSWSIGNDIGGWGQSCSAAGAGGKTYRYLFGWNNKDYTPVVDCGKGLDDAAYLILGQAILNDLANYEVSNTYTLLANSYSDLSLKESAYSKAIQAQPLNIDGYEGLIKTYQLLDKDEATWQALATQINTVYKYHLTALNDMNRLIRPHLSAKDKITIDMNFSQAIKDASKVKDNDMWQGRAIRQMGEFMLGKDKSALATFSFDGNNANKIVINSDYANSRIEIQYSFDSFKTYETYLIDENCQIELTSQQLQSINANDDIQLKISGSNSIFTIDIKLPNSLDNVKIEANDDENRFYGNLNNLEYSFDNVTWSTLSKETLFKGNIETVYYRYRSYGTTLGSETKTTSFTENLDLMHQYIPVAHISLISAPAHQNGEDAVHLVDGNPFTLFHSKHNQFANSRDIVVELDHPRYLSAISYDPRNDGGKNGNFKSVEVYASRDNIDYTLVASATDLANDATRKTITFESSTLAQYIKVKVSESYGDTANKFISGRRLNFYEDLTRVSTPTIEYSTTNPTNKDVIAQLVLPEGYKADVTSYTFTDNGTYAFNYIDLKQNTHSISATVTWIDKIAPTATIVYSNSQLTNQPVIAYLTDFSESVKFVSDNLQDNNSFIFYDNGTYNFIIEDNVGNQTTLTATVDWIDIIPPKVEVEVIKENDHYYAQITQSNEPATFRDGSTKILLTELGTYTIEVIDTVGNVTFVEITVESDTKPTLPPAQQPSLDNFNFTIHKDSISVESKDSTDIQHEYSLDGYIWQDSPTFTNLYNNTEYTLYIRVKATETNSASPYITSTFRTKKAPLIHDIHSVNAVEGDNLHDIVLNYGWTWLSENTVLTIGIHTYQIQLVANDPDTDYSSIEGYNTENQCIIRDIEVNVTYSSNTNTPPQLQGSNVTLYVGDSFNPLDHIKVMDNEDGEITLTYANITENNVNTSIEGSYHVTYTVTDSHGATSTLTITVTVVAKASNTTPPSNNNESKHEAESIPSAPETTVPTQTPILNSSNSVKPNQTLNNQNTIQYNEPPVITASDLTFMLSDDINPLKNVSAYDKEDGDITDKIEVTGMPETIVANTYKITYSVTDSNGQKATITVNLTIIEDEIENELDQDKAEIQENIESNKTQTTNRAIFFTIASSVIIISTILLYILIRK